MCTKEQFHYLGLVLSSSVFCFSPVWAAEVKQPVKLFILAGDEMCLEQGVISGTEPGTLETVVAQNPKYAFLKSRDGAWMTRNDVVVYDLNPLLIHFNWGVWDAMYHDSSSKYNQKHGNTTAVADYEQNLRTLVARLKQTGATLIFANTTPVWEGEPGMPNGDVEAFNRVARKVMDENGVIYEDLNAEVRRQGHPKSHDVHSVGNLAPKVVEGLLKALVVGGMSHVGAGNGFRVYLNGKQLVEHKQGLPGRPSFTFFGCPHIGKNLWPEFEREVTIAAIAFLAYGDRPAASKELKPNGDFSIWLQEMKMPPLGEEEIRRSATAVPMLCSEWQAMQDPDRTTDDADEGKFRWDGKFLGNAKVLGSWTQVGQVSTVDEFNPGERFSGKTGGLLSITFKDQGKTDDALRIWSSNVLMDLKGNQALKMEIRTINGSDYLFIETGGFNAKHPAGWKSSWYVMKRKPTAK